MKHGIAAMIVFISSRIFTPILTWCLNGNIPATQIATAPDRGYIESTEVNPFVVLAACDDREAELDANAERFQSTLNGCLESVQVEQINAPAMMMFAGLIKAGRQPDDAMNRVMANMMHLGMFVERRLKKEAA